MNWLELLGFGSIIDFEKEDEGMEKEEMIERLVAFRNSWENPKSATPDFWEEVIEAVKVGDDAISRQAAIDACLNGWNKDYKEIMADIRELPPVNSSEKVGHWEWVQYDSNPNIGNWHCSECRTIIPHMPEEKDNTPIYKWCPMCGSRMMQEVEE